MTCNHIETNIFAVPLYFVYKHTLSDSVTGIPALDYLINSPKDLRGELGVSGTASHHTTAL